MHAYAPRSINRCDLCSAIARITVWPTYVSDKPGLHGWSLTRSVPIGVRPSVDDFAFISPTRRRPQVKGATMFDKTLPVIVLSFNSRFALLFTVKPFITLPQPPTPQ